MLFKCRPVGMEFLEKAPYLFKYQVRISASAEQVFEVLEDWENWPNWYKAVGKITPTCEKPYGLGSTRITSMKGGIAADETFFIWEKNRRKAFYTTGTNIPCASALAELYDLTEHQDGTCLFEYTVAMDPIRLLKLTGPVGKFLVEKTFSKAAQGLADYVEANVASQPQSA